MISSTFLPLFRPNCVSDVRAFFATGDPSESRGAGTPPVVAWLTVTMGAHDTQTWPVSQRSKGLINVHKFGTVARPLWLQNCVKPSSNKIKDDRSYISATLLSSAKSDITCFSSSRTLSSK